VHASTETPSATDARAVASETIRSAAPSSIAGRIWQCKLSNGPPPLTDQKPTRSQCYFRTPLKINHEAELCCNATHKRYPMAFFRPPPRCCPIGDDVHFGKG
jgi:hypothetical protein